MGNGQRTSKDADKDLASTVKQISSGKKNIILVKIHIVKRALGGGLHSLFRVPYLKKTNKTSLNECLFKMIFDILSILLTIQL